MTISREERMARVRAEMRRRLERRREERKRKRFLPPPRYDDVYFEGLACLDRLAGEPIPLGPVAVTFNPGKEETMELSENIRRYRVKFMIKHRPAVAATVCARGPGEAVVLAANRPEVEAALGAWPPLNVHVAEEPF